MVGQESEINGPTTKVEVGCYIGQ